jgi:hypothetical protein
MINGCLHVDGYLPESRIKLNSLSMALQVTTELCFNISLDIRSCPALLFDPSNKVEIQHNFNQLIDHFKSQGKSDKYNVNFKNKIGNHITQYKEMLTENQTTDKPFTVSVIKQCIIALKSFSLPSFLSMVGGSLRASSTTKAGCHDIAVILLKVALSTINQITENPTTDKPFTVSVIKQCIIALKSNKSAGHDLISNEIAIYGRIDFLFLIQNIFSNTSF